MGSVCLFLFTAQAAPGLWKAEAAAMCHLPAQLPGHCTQQGRPTPAPAPARPSPEAREVSKDDIWEGVGGGQGWHSSLASAFFPSQGATSGLEGLPVGEEPKKHHYGVISSA